MRVFEEKKMIHCFVAGSIAVGKSTTLDYLKKKFIGNDGIYFMKEYIDYMEDGQEMLSKSLNGELDLLEFQKYIVKSFTEQLLDMRKKSFYGTQIVIWERHPMEALEIFARSLDDEQKDLLRVLIHKMMSDFNIPELNGDEITYILSFDTRMLTPMHISDCLYNHLLDCIASDIPIHMWVYLHCDVSAVEQLIRIQRRGRECEIKEYANNNKLVKINTYYSFLYRRMIHELRLHFGETDN